METNKHLGNQAKNHSQSHQGHPSNKAHHHHILPVKTALAIGTTLLILTAVTVGISRVDLGSLNFVIAMVVATVKALLVGLFFMGLLYDKRENAMIFLTSFVFLGIFMTLTSTDLFFRGDVYVKGPLMAPGAEVKSKIAKPWISSPELIAHGKEIFTVQCVACHGAEGKGDGPAAAALIPPPRNFAHIEGWKNGRSAAMVFKTLKEGLPPSAMASYATLPADDRWALAHFVGSLGPSRPELDSAANFSKIGIDPTKESVVEKVAATIPVSFAMSRMAIVETEAEANALLHPSGLGERSFMGGAHELYQASCIQCHGERGEGRIKVKNLGVLPVAFVTTRSFRDGLEGMKSLEAFTQVVIHGYPGDIMPGMGQLGSSEIRDLYQYVQGFAKE